MTDKVKFCTECGQKNPVDGEFCTNCGHGFIKKADTESAENEKAEVTSTVEQKQPIKNSKNDAKDKLTALKTYIMSNKKIVGIGAGVLVVGLAIFFFFSGSIEARGTWESTDAEFYERRERYNAEIKRNGEVEIFVDRSDALNGTLAMTFSVKEDEWLSEDTRKAYALDEVKSLEMVVPNLTYQFERSEIVSELSNAGLQYEVEEGNDEVTISFVVDKESNDYFGTDYETIIELVDENDKDNTYGESYVIFSGLNGSRVLFNR